MSDQGRGQHAAEEVRQAREGEAENASGSFNEDEDLAPGEPPQKGEKSEAVGAGTAGGPGTDGIGGAAGGESNPKAFAGGVTAGPEYTVSESEEPGEKIVTSQRERGGEEDCNF